MEITDGIIFISALLVILYRATIIDWITKKSMKISDFEKSEKILKKNLDDSIQKIAKHVKKSK